MTLAEAEKLVVSTLKQVMEEKMSVENCEVCVIRADNQKLEYRSKEYI
jgi:20S proteasome alpha/beta subunit